jgi:hypothetical protein
MKLFQAGKKTAPTNLEPKNGESNELKKPCFPQLHRAQKFRITLYLDFNLFMVILTLLCHLKYLFPFASARLSSIHRSYGSIPILWINLKMMLQEQSSFLDHHEHACLGVCFKAM